MQTCLLQGFVGQFRPLLQKEFAGSAVLPLVLIIGSADDGCGSCQSHLELLFFHMDRVALTIS